LATTRRLGAGRLYFPSSSAAQSRTSSKRARSIFCNSGRHEKARDFRGALLQETVVGGQRVVSHYQIPAGVLLTDFKACVAMGNKMLQAENMKVEPQDSGPRTILEVTSVLPDDSE
jgi:hypothetical protein